MRHLITILLVLSCITVIACDCKSIDNLEKAQEWSYQNHELIFIGRVLETNEDGTYQFEILEILKGNPDSTIVRGETDNNCSRLPDQTYKTWLVYTNINAEGVIDIDGCGISRSFDKPFISLKGEPFPEPPIPKSDDVPMQIIEIEVKMTDRKERHLKILKDEIHALRKRN